MPGKKGKKGAGQRGDKPRWKKLQEELKLFMPDLEFERHQLVSLIKAGNKTVGQVLEVYFASMDKWSKVKKETEESDEEMEDLEDKEEELEDKDEKMEEDEPIVKKEPKEPEVPAPNRPEPRKKPEEKSPIQEQKLEEPKQLEEEEEEEEAPKKVEEQKKDEPKQLEKEEEEEEAPKKVDEEKQKAEAPKPKKVEKARNTTEKEDDDEKRDLEVVNSPCPKVVRVQISALMNGADKPSFCCQINTVKARYRWPKIERSVSKQQQIKLLDVHIQIMKNKKVVHTMESNEKESVPMSDWRSRYNLGDELHFCLQYDVEVIVKNSAAQDTEQTLYVSKGRRLKDLAIALHFESCKSIKYGEKNNATCKGPIKAGSDQNFSGKTIGDLLEDSTDQLEICFCP